MEKHEWQEIQRLYLEALEVATQGREEFVRANASRPEVADEVLRMLRTGAEDSSRLEPPRPRAGGAGPATDPRLRPGERLGDFELLEEIGRGGMGVVFLARQVSLDREVALKVLPIHVLTSLEAMERFAREGRTAARLQHPNIVQIHMVGQEEAAHFIAMEYLAAGDLAQELARQRDAAGRGSELPSSTDRGHAASCARLIAQVADAVQYAHEQGVVHRDIKPQNLLISAEGTLKLSDFGLVRDRTMGSLTRSGTLLGTLAYMSPEQTRRAASPVDHRTDVYSLGAVLYELLTLQPAFASDSEVELLSQIAEREPAPVRKLNRRVPADLELICRHAMAKDPRDRYGSAAELAADLRRFLGHESILARRPPLLLRARRHLQRRWRTYGLAAAVPLVALATWAYAAHAAEADRAAGQAAFLRGVLAADDWDALEPRRMTRFFGLVAELHGDAPSDPELATAAQSCLRRIVSERRALQDLAQRAATTPQAWSRADVLELQRVLQSLSRYEPLRWLDEDEAFAFDVLLPRLSVEAVDPRGVPVPATVAVHVLDPETGLVASVEQLGSTPVAPTVFQEVYARIVVTPADGRPRELTRHLALGSSTVALRCVIDDRRDGLAGMVSVPAVTADFRAVEGRDGHHGRTVDVPAFLVDPYPVTVRAFLDYLEATGAPRPRFWEEVAKEDETLWAVLSGGDYDDRPMTGVAWTEARAYAEWRGVRLWTAVERDLLALGADGARTFPDGRTTRADFVVGRAVPLDAVEAATSQASSYAELAADYLRHAQPVTADPRPTPDHGIAHLLDCVWEWTESVPGARPGSDATPPLQSRTLVGSSWAIADQRPDARSRRVRSTGPMQGAADLGFRCAATAAR